MDSEEVLPTKNGDPIKLKRVGGDLLVPNQFQLSDEKLDMIKQIECKAGDILLCSFPKSGTHWMLNIMKKVLMRKMDDTKKEKFANQMIGLLEMSPPENLANAVSPRIPVTHLPPNRLPAPFLEGKAKIVLVFRNPKDVAVSFFHHLKNAKMISNKQDWNEYIESFMSDVIPFNSPLQYFKKWEAELKSNSSLDIEYFYFEDLKTNGLENVRRLAKHMNVDLDDKELQAVLDECSLKSLKEEDDNRKGAEEGRKLSKMLLSGDDGKSIIWRKGEIGDWKNHFTVAQNEIYDNLVEEALKDSMFKFRYE